MPEQDTNDAPGQPDHGALGQQPAEKAAPGQPECPQESEFTAPAYHRQRLRRKHEKAAGQQGNRRQQGQIDPIGPRQVAGLISRGLRHFDQHAGRQDGLQCRACLVGHHALGQLQVNPGQPAKLAEMRLHGGDVHHGQLPVFGDAGNLAGNFETAVLRSGLKLDLVARLPAQRTLRGAAEKNTVFRQGGQPFCGRRRFWQ